MPEGIMFSPAGKFECDASEACEQKTDEVLSRMQVAKLEPQELTEFLEFCAEKIHLELQHARKARNSR